MGHATVRAQRTLARQGLELDYSPHVPLAELHALEQVARRVGLPLHELELLGQDRALAAAFVAAHSEGQEKAFLEEVDWDHLEVLRGKRYPVYN